MTNPYEIAYRQSIEDPNTFWAKGTRCSMTAISPFIGGFAAVRSTPVTMPWTITLKTAAATRMPSFTTVR